MALDRQLRVLVKDRVDRRVVGKPGAAARALLFASFLCTLAALGWWAAAGGASRAGRIYSPGHVSRAHAAFEDDCAACHAGDGSGGFRAQVTDAACLACHDGSVHHMNQLVADAPAGVSREARVLAIADAARPAHATLRSADCASCHREHRGDELLAGTSDDHCLVCHSDLSKATKPPADANHPSRRVAARVVAFDGKNHPAFGARLIGTDAAGQARPIDPTKLKFNHRKHLTEVAAFSGVPDDSCVRCHELPSFTPPAVAVEPGSREQPAPPYVVAGAAAQPELLPDGGYVAPIGFERHCVGCHQLDVPPTIDSLNDDAVAPVLADLIAPHGTVAQVNAFVAARLAATLGAADADFQITDEDHEAAEADHVPAASTAASDSAPTDPATPPAPMTVSKRQLWMRANLQGAMENSGASLDEDATASQWTARALGDFLTASVVKNKCATCHELTGEPPVDLASPLTLQTVPTGIPDAPRRWFPASRFDHRAHSDMSCVACHADLSRDHLAALPPDAPAASDTSFVHSPNLDGQVGAARATRSCVDCHHPDGGTFSAVGRGAPAACATCHTFHDRTLEVMPTKTGPTSRPSAVAATP